jgi:hypothetical protein
MSTITATTVPTTTVPTTTATSTSTATSSRRFPVLRAGVRSGVVAAVAATLVAVVAEAAGVALEIDGEAIPMFAYAQLVLAAALVGVGIARLSGRARHPRQAFVVTTVALTVLSLGPDVVADATTATKLVLMLTHVVAAAIVIPALARRVRP